MSHQRQVIRDAVVSALQSAATGNVLAGVSASNVQATRLAPQRESQLPAVTVYTVDETVEEESVLSAPRKLTRLLVLAVEGWVKIEHGKTVDNQLDDLALAIETALHKSGTLTGVDSNAVANDTWLTSTQIGMKLDGQVPMGAVHLGYTTRYFTYAPETADVPLPAFNEIDTKYNLENNQLPDDQAEDLVTGLG